MEDVKHYNQTLIDMKKQLACILGASQTTQMEAKLIRIQVEYHDNWRFWSHNHGPRFLKWTFPIAYRSYKILEAWIGQYTPF